MRSLTFILLLLLLFSSCKKSIEQSMEYCDPTPRPVVLLQTPIKNFTAQYKQKILNPAKDTVLIYESGSRVTILKNSFINKNGTPVKHPVKVLFREFPKATDTYLSGIPMTYGADHFESAAMCEIKTDDPNIIIAPGKTLDISLQSNIANDKDYKQYYLNDTTGKWEFMGNDTVITSKQSDAYKGLKWVNQFENKKVKVNLLTVEPYEPLLLKQNEYFFRLKNVRHMKSHHMIGDYTSRFAYLPIKLVHSDFNLKRFKQDEVSIFLIDRVKNGYLAQLNYKRQSRRETIVPAFTAVHFKKAKSLFDKQLSYYKENEEEIINEKKFKIVKKYIGGYYIRDGKRVNKEEIAESNTSISRFFSVSRLGIYNIDKIYNFETEELLVKRNFDELVNLHAIFPDRNAVIDLSRHLAKRHIPVPKNKKFHLVGSTIEGHIAYIKHAQNKQQIKFNFLKGAQANPTALNKALQ